MQRNQLAKAAALLVAATALTSCFSPKTGVSYQEAIQRYEAALTKDQELRKLFALRKETASRSTTLNFVQGSRWSKISHAAPVKVKATIRPISKGTNSTLRVKARQHRILGPSSRAPAATEKWQQRLISALEE